MTARPPAVVQYGTISDGPCSSCGSTTGVQWEPSYTAYHWDGNGVDPNAPVALCRDWEPDHAAYWKERWDDYYAGLL